MNRGRVLVTGGSTGIGEATALHLRELGFSVLVGVRRDEDADRLREQGLTPIHLDVTVAEQLAAARTEIVDQPLAGLVNNAGITRRGPLEFVPVDDMREQMEVNVIGPSGCYASVPRRTARRPRPDCRCGVDLGTARDADNRSLRGVEIRVRGNERRPAVRAAFARYRRRHGGARWRQDR
jgi:NAD(P)-dependent dehydrogenase (short-subunit alcohol dehydrogenase family)